LFVIRRLFAKGIAIGGIHTLLECNGSPNKKGNTYHALKMVTDELEKEGIETEILHVGNKAIRGCLACGQCAKKQNEQCVQTEDPVNEWIQLMKDADGILLGSPVHYSAIAGTMKSFLDRAFYVSGVNGSLMRHKVGRRWWRYAVPAVCRHLIN
jgi:multimeric flavodoxin WrbA